MVIDKNALLGARAAERSAPAASDAVAFTGAIGIAVGVLLLSGDFSTHGHGRWPGVALFAVLIAVGFLALSLLPPETHPAAVTLIVVGVPGVFGWWLLPNAHKFADIRPFLILTILGWVVCFVAPRTRGRTIFVGAALLLLWLWMLGEAAGTDAYSAAPIPSPPAHTTFSLSALQGQVAVTDLDPTNSLYPTALSCSYGDGSACDTVYDNAEPGSDYEEFGDTCGNTQPAGSGDQCAQLEGGGFSLPGPSDTSPSPFTGGLEPGNFGTGSSDKSLEIGIVSLLFGIAYTGALWMLDRRRYFGLGTALVVPGFLALFTGTEVLGNAAHHVWFGGVLTLVAGLAFALVGDFGGRRFTAWAGAVFAAFGLYLFAGDVTNFKRSFGSVHANLARPALITIGFGIALVLLAWLIAMVRVHYTGPGRSGGGSFGPPPTPPQNPGFPSDPLDTIRPGWPPPVPPPSAPWQPPPAPPTPTAPPAPAPRRHGSRRHRLRAARLHKTRGVRARRPLRPSTRRPRSGWSRRARPRLRARPSSPVRFPSSRR